MVKKVINETLVFWVAAVVIFFDQYTKYLVRANLDFNKVWSPIAWLAPYVRILHTRNSGAAFGMFKNGSLVFTVVAVAEGASEAVSLSIKGVEAGSTFVVKVSTAAVKASSVVVGTSLRVVAESTGYALLASGQLLAFIPNAIGQALLYQSQVK